MLLTNVKAPGPLVLKMQNRDSRQSKNIFGRDGWHSPPYILQVQGATYFPPHVRPPMYLYLIYF